ncbi:hypothetical protein GCM10008938_49060 [Deinococcus roseus]|uniref:histidine kinase n=2 Tax=Deinococcus roseus TaxID=392414 RepID=A0ABQ2DJ80_9DEIO|nr:hypothetical protein GCM10008938_49060 [Deinococcus roseus]
MVSALLGQLNLGLLMFQPDGQITFINPAARTLLHLQDFAEDHLLSIHEVCQHCHNLNATCISRLLLHGIPSQEWVQGLQVHYFLLPEPAGAAQGAIALLPASTFPAVQEFQQQGALDTLFEISPDCLKYMDAQGNLLRMNENGRHLMQVDDFSALQNQPWSELWPEKTRPRVLQAMRDAQTGKIGRFQGFCPTAKNIMRCWDVVVMPILEGPRVVGLVASSRDITEQAMLEQQEREQAEAQKRFVSDAAHELRTPLAAIQGNLDVIFRYPHIEESEKKEILQDVQNSAARLSRLVHDMLQLARGRTGVKSDEEVLLHEVALSAWRDAQRISGSKHHFELGLLEPIELYGDTDRLKQLTLILLENAVKYTPKGGTIRLQLEEQGGTAQLRVQDSGIGIAPENQHHIFERFFRVDRTRVDSRDPGGSGLGLPIAKWIVEAHHGTLEVESALGQGSTFVVRLPLQECSVDP